jgi:hypothetical protein
MNPPSSIGLMVLRAAMLIAAAALPLCLLGAIILWPRSEYVPLWGISLGVCTIGAFVASAAIRFCGKR